MAKERPFVARLFSLAEQDALTVLSATGTVAPAF